MTTLLNSCTVKRFDRKCRHISRNLNAATGLLNFKMQRELQCRVQPLVSSVDIGAERSITFQNKWEVNMKQYDCVFALHITIFDFDLAPTFIVWFSFCIIKHILTRYSWKSKFFCPLWYNYRIRLRLMAIVATRGQLTYYSINTQSISIQYFK